MSEMAPIGVESSAERGVEDRELEKLLRSVYVDGGFTDPQHAAALFAAAAVRARGEILLVRGEAQELLGMVIVVRPDSPARGFATPNEVEMQLLAVAPQARRRRIGRALVDAAVARAASAGYERMILWTQRTMHAAQSLYASAGFSRCPQRDFERAGRSFLGFERMLRAAEPV